MEKEKTKLIVVKICCVLLAVALWLYITKTENPNITYNVRNVPVRLTNADALTQKNLCIERSGAYNVDIRVEGKSSDEKVTKSDFNLYVDLSEYALKEGINKLPIKVEASPNNVSILNNGAQWLQVNIDKLVEATVPVKIDVVENEKKDQFLKQIIIDPKEMKVYGPSRKVKQVKYVLGEFDVSKSNQLKSAAVEVKPANALKDVVTDVTLETNTVNVALGVNTIKSLPIKVITKGDSAVTYKISKTEVNPSIIKVMGDEKIVNELQYIETNPIDISHLRETTVFKKVNLIMPRGIEILDSNSYVDITIVIESKYVEKTINGKIELTNVAAGYIAELSDNKISYTVGGLSTVINHLKDDGTKAYVDLNGLTEGNHKVEIKITLPSDIILVNKTVESINVTIKKGS